MEAIGRLGARLILQQALEDEVTEFLGRARYERAEETVVAPQRLRAADGQDDQRLGRARAPACARCVQARLREPDPRQARDPHLRAGVAGDRLVSARALDAEMSRRCWRTPSTTDQLALDGVADPAGHPRALPALVRAPPGRARCHLPVLRRDLSEAAPRRRARRGRARGVGGDAGGHRRSCSGCSSAAARATRAGWRSAATSSTAACARRR